MKIVVLKGGSSSEREISLKSAEKIAQAYRRNGHDVIELDTVLPFSQIEEEIEVTSDHLENGSRNLVKLLQHKRIEDCDFVFNALHGGIGEDGRVQALLDMMQMHYNGSGYESSGISMDKIVSKLLFQQNQVPTPDWLHFNLEQNTSLQAIVEEVENKFDFPVIVKPSNEGSTVGLHLVQDSDSLEEAIQEALQYGHNILVEEFIEGRELTVGYLNDQPLPVLEIKPKHEIYDYKCKYTKGMSSYEVPARLEPALAKRIQELAIKAYQALKCKGYARIDLRLDSDLIPYFLEMNTLPGMTDTSLVPKAAQAAGIEFDELLEKIMQAGMKYE
ncbi:MAG TPA: D-alanine--D-alanine ligase [bacterium]|nr:D-alanine--D-alanine ligase [bacterium]